MSKILQMGRNELEQLTVRDCLAPLTPDEFFHIVVTIGAFWSYNYKAAKDGKVGLHAKLKSGFHSDGFFVSKILLGFGNMLDIIAYQLVRRLPREVQKKRPRFVAGVPDSATKLGETVASLLGSEFVPLEKRDGRIVLETKLGGGDLLLVEDVCSKATGFLEAEDVVVIAEPGVRILPVDPVILNRGGLELIRSSRGQYFEIRSVVTRRLNDWDTSCPLCEMGSEAIKPKEKPENWDLLVKSQQ